MEFPAGVVSPVDMFEISHIITIIIMVIGIITI